MIGIYLLQNPEEDKTYTELLGMVSRESLLEESINRFNSSVNAFQFESPRFRLLPMSSREALQLEKDGISRYAEISHQEALINYFATISGTKREQLSPAERFSYISSVAQLINNRPYLTVAQLSMIANLDPIVGYYPHHGIGLSRETEVSAASAFMTPAETEETYNEAYASIAISAYKTLQEQRPFTPSEPFSLYFCGEGRGKILGAILNQFESEGIDPSVVNITLIDASPFLLSMQHEVVEKRKIYPSINVVNANAKDLRKYLAGNSRGVIIAGEELADDFGSQVLSLHSRKDDTWGYIHTVYENGYHLHPDGTFQDYEEEIDKGVYSVLQNILQRSDWTLFDRRKVAVNWQFLEMIKGISESKFEGYWYGGDYYGFFKSNFGSRPESPMSFQTLHKEEENVAKALFEIGNITFDVDPSLLSYAEAKGMRREFIGRMLHFIDIGKARQPISKEVIQTFLLLIKDTLAQGEQLEQDDLIIVFKELALLELSLDRFNWVMAKGDVPQLLDKYNERDFW
ncbi:MAG TPA: hypothetical protein VLF89_08845 [Candidatus Saccharimonadales bacterium]|nr:hypothetical protein [Candidatus Saccharimonadales bacterium]